MCQNWLSSNICVKLLHRSYRVIVTEISAFIVSFWFVLLLFVLLLVFYVSLVSRVLAAADRMSVMLLLSVNFL